VIKDIAFWLGIALLDIIVHQDLREISFVHSWVRIEVMLSQSLIIPQSTLCSGNGREKIVVTS
jgi:hypothetical protein